MDNDGRDDVVVDVAEALTLNQDVQWDRCERLATPASRRSLDGLRVFARVREAFAAAADAPPGSSAATTAEPSAGVFVRRFAYALIAVAAVEVTATLALLAWVWDDYHRAYGDLAIYFDGVLIGSVSSACVLLLAMRRDRRTALLAAYFLLNATIVHPSALLALLWGMDPRELFGYPWVYPFMFAPAFLWAFARACPRVHRRTRLDDLSRRMVSVSVAAGCVLWVALAASLESARAGYLDEAWFWAVLDGSIAALRLSEFAAVVVVLLRAPAAPAEEARRFALLGIGFLLWKGLVAADTVVEAFLPGGWLFNYRWSPAVAAVALLRFPGIALLWYSVLAARVPHPREVVRDFYTRLLARGRLLGVLAVAPAAVLGWLVASRLERTVGAVLADPLVQSLAAAAGVLLLVAAGRRRLLARFDAWLHPETTDQRETLAGAVAALAQAAGIEGVRRTVARTIGRACGSPAVLLVASRTETEESFRAPDGRLAPLARASAVVHMLETAGGSLRVHPSDRTSHFELLPPKDAAWVAETEADVVAPVPGPGAELLGVVVVGRRFDDRIVREVDLPFLEALGAAAGLAVARLRVAQATGDRGLEAPAAQECPLCRCLTAAGEPAGCDCGLAYVSSEVPKLLAGKFRLTRRLGSGGMGAAWLARDLRLERDVAVKTLTGVSVARLMGLKPEAWAMATVSHPALAEIHGIESWRGRPLLVVEFLPGGTLADKLRRGPVPSPRAVSVATLLAAGLAALHEAGYLHGDVKPSNIGFMPSGSPKLLDFGLARETNDADTQGGTLRYLSPEVLSGLPATEADDVWSLCVVLHEMVAGEHPFAGGGVDEVAGRIRRRRLGRDVWPAVASSSSSAVVAFTAAMLTASRTARPATARAFSDALSEILP